MTTSNSNVVLVLALTPSGQNVILTGRVLDGASGDVLYELTAQDTPGADPSLTPEQFRAATGMDVRGIVADPAGQPWTSGPWECVMVDQYTDGTLPAAEGTYEAFELRTYDIPPVAICRAVQITVPCSAGASYFLESAPTLNGPWLPVYDPVSPGIQRFTVPAATGVGFFRPRLAP